LETLQAVAALSLLPDHIQYGVNEEEEAGGEEEEAEAEQ